MYRYNLHNCFDFDDTLSCFVRDQCSFNRLAVSRHALDTLLAACGIIYMDLLDIAAEMSCDGHLFDGIRYAGIYDQTVKMRSYTEDML